MSFKDAINRAEMTERQLIEHRNLCDEKRTYWDGYFKARVKPFALETTNQYVIEAYNQMINGRHTDNLIKLFQ